MNPYIKQSFLFLGLALLLHFQLTAQDDGRFSEKKIKEQELFIEAAKFRLLGNLDKAAELYQELIEKDRQNASAAYELARIYADQNKNEEALNLARKAVTLAPDNPWYKKFLADICQRDNLFQEAASLYEQLATNFPFEEYNHYKWAYFLVLAGQTDKALLVYDELEKRIGINEELIRRKHSLYLGMGNTEKAGQELLRLCQAAPRNTDYLHLLASFYGQTNNPQAEKATYQKILQIDPNDSKAYFAINKTASGDTDFFNSLDRVFQNPQADLDEKIKQILPFVEKAAATNDQIMVKDLQRLAAILDQTHPGEAKVHALNADLFYLGGDNEKALERYRQALKLDGTVFSVWEQLFRLAMEMADYETLVDYTEKAMDLYPSQVSVAFYNGLGYCRQEKYAQGIPSLEQAVLMAGRNVGIKVQVLSQLGLAYQYAGNAAKSDQVFQQALQMAPDNPAVLEAYSAALAVRGQALEKALEYIRRSNELAPGNARVEATYGRVLYKQKQYDEALLWFQKALKNGGNADALTLEHYGDLLYQRNDVKQAVEYWQKALDIGFPSSRLQKKIADQKLYE